MSGSSDAMTREPNLADILADLKKGYPVLIIGTLLGLVAGFFFMNMAVP